MNEETLRKNRALHDKAQQMHLRAMHDLTRIPPSVEERIGRIMQGLISQTANGLHPRERK